MGGDINMPIFQGGRLMGNLKAKRAESAATAHTYQQTVLNALQEAESSIAAYTQALMTIQERKTAADRYQELVFLSRSRFEAGLVNRLDLLDSERQLNASEQNLLDSDLTAFLGLVALYKSLGGGWEVYVPKD
ncbi:MAG TPA: TolC family protein [Rhabdochlamydiaceae bacterium]|nr:TolC family protein [Rhabdochlamydiaceae bacterium]